MTYALDRTKRRVTIQYVLLAGVNDQPCHVEELCTFLATVGPPGRLHINLIPYNAQSGTPLFRSPDHDSCKAFKTALQTAGFFVKIRQEKGAEKMAACGQLGNVNLRRQLNARRRSEAEAADAAVVGAEAAEAAEAEASYDLVAAAAELRHEAIFREAWRHGIPIEAGVPGAREKEASRLCGKKELEW